MYRTFLHYLPICRSIATNAKYRAQLADTLVDSYTMHFCTIPPFADQLPPMRNTDQNYQTHVPYIPALSPHLQMNCHQCETLIKITRHMYRTFLHYLPICRSIATNAKYRAQLADTLVDSYTMHFCTISPFADQLPPMRNTDHNYQTHVPYIPALSPHLQINCHQFKIQRHISRLIYRTFLHYLPICRSIATNSKYRDTLVDSYTMHSCTSPHLQINCHQCETLIKITRHMYRTFLHYLPICRSIATNAKH